MTNSPLGSANLRGAVDLSSLVRPPAPAPGAPAATAAGGVVRSATDATFTQVLDLSSTVPVLVEFFGQGIQPALGAIVTGFGGRVALVTVDTATNPQLVQAFQVQQVPTVAAVIGGRPVQLYTGALPQQEVEAVIEQVLQLAAQNGVQGTIPVGDPGAPEQDPDAEPAPEPLPPHHQEAYDAIAAGDFATAIREYETAIAQNPRDQLAVAGLAQVSLLARLETQDTAGALARASAAPDDLDAILAAADVELASGAIDDALERLLAAFPQQDSTGRNLVRTRLLDFFEIAGADDPRVIAARRRLTTLLY